MDRHVNAVNGVKWLKLSALTLFLGCLLSERMIPVLSKITTLMPLTRVVTIKVLGAGKMTFIGIGQGHHARHERDEHSVRDGREDGNGLLLVEIKQG
ncbi:hypothetical protein PF005_g1871 [Phytophthora fragariae]|uniref:Uncharacterized protein n=1 Tax=Phytophthora fragariae TaxID=53985 RepID=A0A6A3ZCT2_9STRA|nr:hypothetical protein PF003_g25015 [Phytophthora fragariae]KAE8947736.1 hypothetical protein PF009_g2684 [Phytophthora fragariae]KAE9027897.1 hypothetical protein PF011_g1824 [Phytophthora fragariae]KAE9234466.1 hypothetical protein PF005_g1871 [Phytophthora fragariae]